MQRLRVQQQANTTNKKFSLLQRYKIRKRYLISAVTRKKKYKPPCSIAKNDSKSEFLLVKKLCWYSVTDVKTSVARSVTELLTTL